MDRSSTLGHSKRRLTSRPELCVRSLLDFPVVSPTCLSYGRARVKLSLFWTVLESRALLFLGQAWPQMLVLDAFFKEVSQIPG